MESPGLQKENRIKDISNLFRLEKLKKETTDTTIKDLTYLFRLENKNKRIKVRIIIDIRICFEHGDIRNNFKLKKMIK